MKVSVKITIPRKCISLKQSIVVLWYSFSYSFIYYHFSLVMFMNDNCINCFSSFKN